MDVELRIKKRVAFCFVLTIILHLNPFLYSVDEYRESSDVDWENPEQAAANQWASVSESYLDQLFTADGSTRASFSGELGPSNGKV